ncbi:uncharacterized protein Z518_03356 [Rhinocladiella mackenziei CBS 650.93]|uniref:MARVEL domain-containing protein n=1 Tax=Rhinocladiella mackenziei CBS 650.93 TaxID=1442369 RepID=A0A0D2IRT0_9EURO|nr:uncharacterized protein Z518_03356 [Rhinocladiella mackenziei CBS 650.93]KIX08699.1 hypothetical protein Z518_03356 [Rhinocladiella mackenziei CBS 650.93]
MTKREFHRQRLNCGIIFYLSLNALQIVGALIVIGIFASDISDGSRHLGRSIFSIVAGVLSVVIAFALIVETFHTVPSRVWLVLVFLFHWCLISLWSVAVGLLGALYFHGGPSKLRAGAAFNLLNLIVWVVASILGCQGCFRRKGKLPKTNDDDGVDLQSKPGGT